MLGIIGEEYKDKIFDDKNDKIEIPIKTSDKIKLALMKYMRFSNQYTAVCTEGVKNADVSGIKDNKLIEVEIKISKSDFKNELKHKQNKHNEYKNPDEHLKASYKNQEIPNKFYFCVPIEMEEWAWDSVKLQAQIDSKDYQLNKHKEILKDIRDIIEMPKYTCKEFLYIRGKINEVLCDDERGNN